MNQKTSNPTKRVLFVDHADRILGGAEINLIELIEEALRHSDWQIAVACRRESMLGDALDQLGVRQFDYGFTDGLNKMRFSGQRTQWSGIIGAMRSLLIARKDLAQIGKLFQPAAVISCTNKDHFAATAAFPNRSVQRIWWVNDLITSDFFSYPVRFAFRQFARRGPDLVAVSDCVEDALLGAGAPASQIHVIHNGIPLERYRRIRRGFLRERLGIPASEPLYGNIGRLTPWKGQDFFINIADEWVKDGLPGHFVLVGKAFNEDHAYENKLYRLSERPGLKGRVHFLGETKEIAGALSDLDVLIHTSVKPEPFGRVLIEAMAVGTPVIAADAGGPHEIIKNGVDGLLARPGYLLDYLRKLRLVSSNSQLRVALVDRAHETVEARFTIQRTFRCFDELLH